MNKRDIISKINEYNYDGIICGESSLVLRGILKKCDNIEVINNCCFDETFKKIEYNTNEYDLIDNIKCMKLDDCLNFFLMISSKKNYKKLKLYLDCLDNYHYERDLIEKGYNLIGGVDEVGRGPLVGPVVAACCILPHDFNLDGLTDSKKLSKAKREYFFEEIKRQAISYGIGIVDEKRIDEINIYQATKEAMIMAINNCNILPEYVLTDAMKLDIDIPLTPIIKGDLKSITISAASVLAKVTRDNMMEELDKKYPMYDFKNNVGYPTKKHLEAIDKYGIIPEHRRSYGPVRDYLLKNE